MVAGGTASDLSFGAQISTSARTYNQGLHSQDRADIYKEALSSAEDEEDISQVKLAMKNRLKAHAGVPLGSSRERLEAESKLGGEATRGHKLIDEAEERLGKIGATSYSLADRFEDELSSRDELFSRGFGGVLTGVSAAEGVVSSGLITSGAGAVLGYSGLITSGAGAVLGYSGLLGSSYGVSRGAEIAFGDYDDGLLGRVVESSFSRLERGGDVAGGYLSSQMRAAAGVASDIAAAHIGAGLAVGAIKGVAVASGAAKSVMFSKPGGSAARASASAKPPAASAAASSAGATSKDSRKVAREIESARVDVREASGKVKFKKWQRGDAIDKPLPDGSDPGFGTVRARYWKNRHEAVKDKGEFKKRDLDRMDEGLAPQDYDLRTKKLESRELHHHIPQRHMGKHDPLNLREVTPEQYRAIDKFRR